MTRLLVLAILALVACGGSSPPTDAGKILRDSANAMANVRTVSATLKLTKGVVSIKGFTLVSARTSVRMPTDSDTVYTVKQEDVSFALEIVIAGGHVYEHIPFTPFREVTGAEAKAFPDMAKLFDAATGLPAIIPAGTATKYVASEQLDGKQVDHVTTQYTPEQVRGLLAYLNSSGPVSANLWVRSSDHLIPKAVLDGAFGDLGKDAAVEVDITNFNGTVSITSPAP
jgi:hypothetical protein